MRSGVACMIIAAGALACGDAAGPEFGQEITIQTNSSDYEPGQLIIVTTTNRSDHVVYDDHCGGEVQGFEFLGRWNASYGAMRACYLFDRAGAHALEVPIPGGSTHADTFHVNGQAYSGTWRVRLYLRGENGVSIPESQAVSNTFRVGGTWSP